MLRAVLLSLLLVLPHATLAQGGALANAQTDIAGVYTAQVRISDHPHHVLMGHVVIVTRAGTTARALVIRQRRDGVHRLHLREAWMDGTRLPYARDRGHGCSHGHCLDRPVGRILLSASLFAHAGRHGLRARLIGPGGAIDIAAPPALFREGAARAAAM